MTLELAEPPESPHSSDPKPMLGTSPRWIPDTPPPAVKFVPAEKEEAGTPAGGVDVGADAPIFVPKVPVEAQSATARIRKRRKRSPSKLLVGGTIGSILLGAVVAVFLLTRGSTQGPPSKVPTQQNPAREAERQQLAASDLQAAELSPTSGDPIPLNYVPFTPHLILHLRPSALWQRDRHMKEFEATLGNVGIWLKQNIREICTFEPEEIEELTFAVNFGVRTSIPDVSAVVRLRDTQTPADLFRRFNGTRRTDLDADVIESSSRSYLIVDTKTFAVAPVSMSEELASAARYPAMVPAEMEPLLKESDRQRHCTLMFDLNNLDVHREFVLIDQLQTIADQFIVWMGKDVRTISWSLHLQPHFFMETLLHQSNDSTATKVQRAVLSRLEKLPDQMLSAVRKMQPATEGTRRMIGRFPAMLRAVQLGTSADVGSQHARFVTILPGKAASNLAAATLLTWNQSLLTDFSAADSIASKSDDFPEKVMDRLKLTVLIDFRNFPLQEAMDYIGDVLRTEIVIDGDALKAAGFTQNLNQTMNLGNVTALQAFDAILRQYAAERDPMVISVDEAGGRIILGTRSAAELKGLKILSTSP